MKEQHVTTTEIGVQHHSMPDAACLEEAHALAADDRSELQGHVSQFPDPTAADKPWPVRIFTLGRFSILVDGLPPQHGRKIPHRPLDLLKALIAMGGRRVSCTKLAAMLWPDVDGDTARKTFDTTLYRLRKLLKHNEALLCVDGTLSLDATYCWVDTWAFERLIGRVNRVVIGHSHEANPVDMQRMCDHMFRLYQDHFLQNEDTSSWSISMRERLRSKFVHHLVECGDYWEQRADWKRALECYRKGLEVDDVIELFYQRIMVCYLELDRNSEGMAVYRRCRQILSVVLGLKPESRTEQIYEELKYARTSRRPA